MPHEQFNLIWWVLGLPLIGFLLQSLAGKVVVDALGQAIGKRVMGTLAVLPVAGAFGIGAYLTSELAKVDSHHRSVVLELFSWIGLKNLEIPFEVVVDPLSMTMVLIITGIGALIHLYATGYMAEEKDYTRFFTYFNLFIVMMLVLVLGNNLVLLFIGWEGVGLCSYLLIGFWYKDLANARAGNKAFITNRVGDWALTLGMFLMVAVMLANRDKLVADGPRWLSYDVLLPNMLEVLKGQPALAAAIAILLFVGAAGKSAQFPLYLWLPDAMAGPTPVSALIHAATMVTAGVFLLNRMHPVFEMSPMGSAVVAGIGGITALFAALIAFGQTDIKKVLAYSTVSQLGFMFIACGAGAYWAGMFHVITHAFFKALLFLGSGAVIHAMNHEQDMRHYGNLMKYVRITAFTMIVGWLAIAGVTIWDVAGISGFYSKEAALGAALGSSHAVWGTVNVGYFAGWAGLLAALFTAAYMTRMTWLTFFGGQERWRDPAAFGFVADAHGHDHGHHHAHHEHAHAHHEDPHGFFYTDEEMERRAQLEEHEHHHALDPEHKPHEVPVSMWLPLVVLAIPSLVAGWLLYKTKIEVHGEKVPLLEGWLYPNGLSVLGHDVVKHYPDWKEALIALSMAIAFGGILFGYACYRKGLPANQAWDMTKWAPWRLAARNQFGYDELVVGTAVEGGGAFARAMAWIDSRVVDGLVNFSGWITTRFGAAFRMAQTGFVRGYALLMLFGGVVFLGWLVYAVAQIGGGPQ